MPTAKIQAPDGRIITLEVPEGATQEQILAFVQSQQGTQAPQQVPQQVVEEPQQVAEPQQPATFGEEVLGGVEGFATLASGALATPIAGIAGALETLNPFAEEGAGERAVRGVQEALTFQPRTEAGKQALEPVQALGQKIESGKKFLGEETLAATGSPLLASIAHTLPDATLSLLGLKSVTGPGKQQLSQIQQLDRIKKLPANKKQLLIAEQIKSGNPNIDNITKFVTESGDIVTSKASRVALKVLGKGERAQQTVSVIERMNTASKAKFNQMLDIVQKGKFEPLFRDANRPGDILGQSIAERARAVFKINKDAGKAIGDVAKSLKNKQVNISNPRQQFFSQLDELGVKFKQGEDGFVTPDFSRSKFIGGSQKDMNVLVNDLLRDNVGFEFAHNLKRSIRDNLDFDKGGSGKIGKGTSENILKNLATGIDDILDITSDRYNIANTKFAKTKGIVDRFDKLAGKDINIFDDLSAQALSNKAKRLTSNATSRTAIQRDLTDIDNVLKDLGVRFKDDIPSLVHVTNQLEKIFDIAPQNSLQGNLLSAGRRLAQGDIPIAETAAIAKKALTASERKQFLGKIKVLRDLANTNSKGQ